MVTTDWVLTEVVDALAAPANRALAVALLDSLQHDPHTIIIPAEHGLFEAGLDLFRGRPDKEWTLTDCISFVVMQRHQLTEALTADHHFEQAGFSILLK